VLVPMAMGHMRQPPNINVRREKTIVIQLEAIFEQRGSVGELTTRIMQRKEKSQKGRKGNATEVFPFFINF
jgi:hypothetical protein